MPPNTMRLAPVMNYFALNVNLGSFFISVLVMCLFPIITEGGWLTWGQWKQSVPGVRARIRTKDTQEQCPHKYQGNESSLFGLFFTE